MSDNSTVQDGQVVLFQYTLKDDRGEVVDASDGETFCALIGQDNIVDGLERELLNKEVGSSFTCTVLPEDGYGKHDGNTPKSHPRADFPPEIELFEGLMLGVSTPNKKEVAVYVTKFDDEWVWLDHNHPLAGKTLTFDIKIEGVREPTKGEVAHGHPHGPTGNEGH